MVAELTLALLLVATIAGALIDAVLGWKDAGNPFDFAKFWPSIVRAVIAALIVFTATYTGFVGEVNIFTYIAAFLIGIGVDASGNRVAGIITAARSA
jgi:hypothetical protein